MPDISEALERLVTDPGFLEQLRTDPAAALGGYRLNQADLDVLTSQFNDAAGAQHGVEQRTSKSAILGALSGFSDAADGGSASADLAAAGDPENVDKASPTLSIACCTGEHNPEDHDLVLSTPGGETRPGGELAEAGAAGAEEAEQVYPGVYVQEAPSSDADPDRPVIVGAVPNTGDDQGADIGRWTVTHADKGTAGSGEPALADAGAGDAEAEPMTAIALAESGGAGSDADPGQSINAGSVPNPADESAEAPAAADLGSRQKAEGLD